MLEDRAAKAMRVGELAERTGLTVRTLHHYDEIGLLSPSRHSAAGHRLYGDDDVRRLQQIVSLRQLGFALDEISGCLDRPGFSPLDVIELHARRLDEEIESARRLRQRLYDIAQRLREAEEISTDDFLQTIEAITMFQKYYTPEQLQQLDARARELGEDRLAQAQNDWQEIFDGFRKAMHNDEDPASDAVQELAARAQALIAEFTGGDSGIAASLSNMYREEDDVTGKFGMPVGAELWQYMGRARAAREEKS